MSRRMVCRYENGIRIRKPAAGYVAVNSDYIGNVAFSGQCAAYAIVTPDLNVRFHGMVGNDEKGRVANSSRGLVFPVLWDEPFGLAVVEAMYFGAPVFGATRGSLPELVIPDAGVLSESPEELAG